MSSTITSKIFLGLCLSLSVGLLPVSSWSAPTKEELKIGINQEFENLNPIIMSMQATTYLNGLASRTLTTMNPDGKWVTNLAKSIPTFENGQAKLTADKKFVVATWEILEKAKWGDGQPVICEDLALSIKVAASENVSVGSKEDFTQIASMVIDPKNPKKCTFTYDKARWDYYMLGRTYFLPSHLEKPIFEKYGSQKEGYEKNSNYSKNPTNPGLYNGPYVISDVKLGSHVSFTINPHFYGKTPKIKKIIMKLIPNTGALEANLRSNTIDAISIMGLTFDQGLAFDKKVKKEKLPFEVMFKTSLVYEHIDLNLDNPFLKDVRVRKALVYALNRDELSKALFEGRQEPAIHMISPIDPWFTKDPKIITTYSFNKKEASRLLDESGWKMGADGYRAKDGKRLSFMIMTTAGNKIRETVETFLQGQWKSVGVELTIKNEPARVFFGDTNTHRKFPAMAMYAWTSYPEQTPKSTLHSSQIPTEKNGWSGQNFPGYVNPKMDALIEKLEVEFNPKKRIALAHEITKLYTDEVPVIPLYYRAEIAVRPVELLNFRISGSQFSDSGEAENWDIK